MQGRFVDWDMVTAQSHRLDQCPLPVWLPHPPTLLQPPSPDPLHDPLCHNTPTLTHTHRHTHTHTHTHALPPHTSPCPLAFVLSSNRPWRESGTAIKQKVTFITALKFCRDNLNPITDLCDRTGQDPFYLWFNLQGDRGHFKSMNMGDPGKWSRKWSISVQWANSLWYLVKKKIFWGKVAKILRLFLWDVADACKCFYFPLKVSRSPFIQTGAWSCLPEITNHCQRFYIRRN